jgi:hypothetical protein
MVTHAYRTFSSIVTLLFIVVIIFIIIQTVWSLKFTRNNIWFSIAIIFFFFIMLGFFIKMLVAENQRRYIYDSYIQIS